MPFDPSSLIGANATERFAIEAPIEGRPERVIYRGRDRMRGDPVVLEVLPAFLAVAPEARSKVYRALVLAVAQLRETAERADGMIAPREAGTLALRDGGWLPFVVRPFIEAAPLARVLADEERRRVEPRSMLDAIDLLEPVALALGLAHERGACHGDVTAHTVVLARDAHTRSYGAVLVDFVMTDAFAVARRSGVAALDLVGPAPEQRDRRRGEPGPWSDVFGLAELLLSVLAPGVETVAASTPRELGRAAASAVDDVFRRALAESPADRYARAGTFWNDLRMAIGLEPLRSFVATMPRISVHPTPPGRQSSLRPTSRSVAPSMGAGAEPSARARTPPRMREQGDEDDAPQARAGEGPWFSRAAGIAVLVGITGAAASIGLLVAVSRAPGAGAAASDPAVPPSVAAAALAPAPCADTMIEIPAADSTGARCVDDGALVLAPVALENARQACTARGGRLPAESEWTVASRDPRWRSSGFPEWVVGDVDRVPRTVAVGGGGVGDADATRATFRCAR